jgi:hypothetical protein
MTRKDDFTIPWGREPLDDIVFLKIKENSFHAHRDSVLRQRTVIDDSDPYKNNVVGDLFNSGKRPQLRRDRQSLIDTDNRKMVENMADTLRNVSL